MVAPRLENYGCWCLGVKQATYSPPPPPITPPATEIDKRIKIKPQPQLKSYPRRSSSLHSHSHQGIGVGIGIGRVMFSSPSPPDIQLLYDPDDPFVYWSDDDNDDDNNDDDDDNDDFEDRESLIYSVNSTIILWISDDDSLNRYVWCVH